MWYQYQFHIRLDMFLQIYDTNLLFSPVLDSLKNNLMFENSFLLLPENTGGKVPKDDTKLYYRRTDLVWSLSWMISITWKVIKYQLISLQIIFMLLLNPSRFVQIHIICFMKTRDKHAFFENLIFFFRFRFKFTLNHSGKDNFQVNKLFKNFYNSILPAFFASAHGRIFHGIMFCLFFNVSIFQIR